ncbi:MAG: gamma-glutamyltransferase [Pseudomonadota bacterium]
MRPLTLLPALALSLALSPPLHATDQPEKTFGTQSRATVIKPTYMVTSAHPLATEAGRAVLAAGGHAADAAVAVQFMLNLVEPQSSGIGGGAFAVYRDAATGAVTTFDGREQAPLAATESLFLTADGERMGWWDAVIGGRSVGVPGTLALLDDLHKRFGRQAWPALLAPTERTARDGFTVTERMAQSIAWGASKDLGKYPATRALFFKADGSPYAAGDTLTNPDFADTVALLAREGIAPFYRGELAAALVEAVSDNDNPGTMQLDDLASYRVIERPAVCAPYRGYEVCGMGPPSSGALTVGQMLGLLSGFDLPGLGNSAAAWHLFAEAGKLAYADRALYMADSDFVPLPLAGLLDPGYLRARSTLIDPAQAMEKASAGNPPWPERTALAADLQRERAGTSHFNIVDAEGNALSVTTTIETGFGSRLSVGGFLLNNELTDFSFLPEKDGKPIANRVEPGKRPRSSMSPTIVLEDGEPALLIGSPGGSRIINYVAQSLVAILDWDMDLQAALDLGHVANRNGATDLEEGTPAADLQAELEALGHTVTVRNMNSGLHAIRFVDGVLHGAADPRRDGTADGG